MAIFSFARTEPNPIASDNQKTKCLRLFQFAGQGHLISAKFNQIPLKDKTLNTQELPPTNDPAPALTQRLP